MKEFKILIVEDNELNIKYLDILMRKWNIHYDIARNGLEAIEKTCKIVYNLIFMDIHMPFKNGFETTINIRNEENLNSHTPIVALTADSVKEQVKKANDIGMNGFLSKPFVPEEIYNIIRQFQPEFFNDFSSN